MANDYILCYKCHHEITPPADFVGKIICPKCKSETWVVLRETGNGLKTKELQSKLKDLKDSNFYNQAVEGIDMDQIITNEQKIKELEAALKCGNDYYEELSKIRKENNDRIKAEIEELRKTEYEIDDNGDYSILLGKYLRFKTASHRDYCVRGVQAYVALAKFSEKYDPAEKDREWNGVIGHWFVLKMEGKWSVGADRDNYDPTTVYFSTKELAKAALEMLKREGFI